MPLEIINVGANQIGVIHKSGTRVIENTVFKCEQTKTATAIKQTGGRLILRNVWIDGGVGPQIWCGDEFVWEGGGSLNRTIKYGVGYFGNIHPGVGTRIKIVRLSGLRFTHHSRDEALLRAMGVDEMYLTDCELDGSGHIGKQVCQWRHVKKLVVSDCDFKNSLVFGTLDAKGCKSNAERIAYHDDAKRFRISASFDDKCRLWGYAMVGGQTDLVVNGMELMGRDIRNGVMIGGNTCFTKQYIPDVKNPTITLKNIINTGKWPKIQ